MFVETILQTKGTGVHTLRETAVIAEAVTLLNTNNIGAIVITDPGNRIVGILSERDIVRQLGRDPSGTMGLPVSACMTPNVITCERATKLDDVLARMTERRIRHMPVAEDGILAGIISIGDVVKLKIATVEHEAEALRDYIAS